MKNKSSPAVREVDADDVNPVEHELERLAEEEVPVGVGLLHGRTERVPLGGQVRVVCGNLDAPEKVHCRGGQLLEVIPVENVLPHHLVDEGNVENLFDVLGSDISTSLGSAFAKSIPNLGDDADAAHEDRRSDGEVVHYPLPEFLIRSEVQ